MAADPLLVREFSIAFFQVTPVPKLDKGEGDLNGPWKLEDIFTHERLLSVSVSTVRVRRCLDLLVGSFCMFVCVFLRVCLVVCLSVCFAPFRSVSLIVWLSVALFLSGFLNRD